jgi:hypothetical protein
MFGLSIILIYLLGAAVVWRVSYSRIIGPVYERMAGCNRCVDVHIDDGTNTRCSVHGNDWRESQHESRLVSIFWPIVVVLGLFVAVGFTVAIATKRVLFPRGIRTKGYVAWNKAVADKKLEQERQQLERELRKLGEDHKKWLPSASEDTDSAGSESDVRRMPYYARQIAQREHSTNDRAPEHFIVNQWDGSRITIPSHTPSRDQVVLAEYPGYNIILESTPTNQ